MATKLRGRRNATRLFRFYAVNRRYKAGCMRFRFLLTLVIIGRDMVVYWVFSLGLDILRLSLAKGVICRFLSVWAVALAERKTFIFILKSFLFFLRPPSKI